VLEITHGKKVVYKQPPGAAALKQKSRLIGCSTRMAHRLA
jgi:hypothetical protein